MHLLRNRNVGSGTEVQTSRTPSARMFIVLHLIVYILVLADAAWENSYIADASYHQRMSWMLARATGPIYLAISAQHWEACLPLAVSTGVLTIGVLLRRSPMVAMASLLIWPFWYFWGKEAQSIAMSS